ncbi:MULTISPECIES: helix-turn-helix transcriptional regulator [unclassified Streptomyces]|uniref:helix-turn-helix transcriptional regulator n=1 Tax=unclassified Streptomyces TaxID=2593676 RepID=UPI002ED4CBE8|nr:helix-turn-helix transcriptional regulator [Streptomyces sp. NBC_00891]WSY09607.1 helix-turn-helix transcriptional regulator [Streptomyces sp. NBC_00890]WSZ11227.1 helix-turn-helix transcriptional regulator [Streptomyces sp. NBC_00869]WSZ21268.1 helix-turn-helix transcriptional regulator [Streptomyces sp. NBC_00870]
MKTDRPALADFLRRSRERIRPPDVGLHAGPRRRTPGLRREEVAQLAGMSVDYYIRLEQSRGPHPSPEMLAALARALRLTDDERDHLHLLAGQHPPTARTAGEHVSPGLLHLLDQLPATPVQVIGGLGDVLAQNAMAEALLGGVCTVSEHGRNIVWRWFSDPAQRTAYPPEEHAYYSRLHVADLRAAVGRRAGDPAATRLVERLRTTGEEFTALWELHEVSVRRASRIRVLHPLIGAVELDCQVLLAPEGDQRVVLHTPPVGSQTAERLALLKVVGTGQFTTPG